MEGEGADAVVFSEQARWQFAQLHPDIPEKFMTGELGMVGSVEAAVASRDGVPRQGQGQVDTASVYFDPRFVTFSSSRQSITLNL